MSTKAKHAEKALETLYHAAKMAVALGVSLSDFVATAKYAHKHMKRRKKK